MWETVKFSLTGEGQLSESKFIPDDDIFKRENCYFSIIDVQKIFDKEQMDIFNTLPQGEKNANFYYRFLI